MPSMPRCAPRVRRALTPRQLAPDGSPARANARAARSSWRGESACSGGGCLRRAARPRYLECAYSVLLRQSRTLDPVPPPDPTPESKPGSVSVRAEPDLTKPLVSWPGYELVT
jgi:hypothetical protein